MNGRNEDQGGSFRCPKCGAEVYDGARFCLHCMTRFDEKTEIGKKKPSGRRKVIVIAAVVCAAILAITASILIAGAGEESEDPAGDPAEKSTERAETDPVTDDSSKDTEKPSDTEAEGGLYRDGSIEYDPICRYEDFLVRVAAASGKLGLDDMWDPSTFRAVATLEDGALVRYSADAALPDALVSASFYEDGKYIILTVADVAPEIEADAAALLACMANAVYNNYTDVYQILTDRKQFPLVTIGEPFFEYFTDILRRTEAYKKDIENGAEISTGYITFGTGNDDLLSQFYRTERRTDGATMYDLTVLIDYLPAYRQG